ncbi:MAG: pyridoxal-phosphate dependent enzyme, partial [Nitriliruptor sp.]
MLTSTALGARTGGALHLKAEHLQRVGAFKFRGAYNAIAAVDATTRQRGIVAFSSGNHAQAVALACRLQGVRATIVMPDDAPPVKLAATEG